MIHCVCTNYLILGQILPSPLLSSDDGAQFSLFPTNNYLVVIAATQRARYALTYATFNTSAGNVFGRAGVRCENVHNHENVPAG